MCKALKARWKQQIENEIRKIANFVFSLGVQDRKIAQVMDEKQNFEGPKNANKTFVFVYSDRKLQEWLSSKPFGDQKSEIFDRKSSKSFFRNVLPTEGGEHIFAKQWKK